MPATAEDINCIAHFLAAESDQTPQPADCLVLCVSALLTTAETVFTHLQTHPGTIKTLVLCGGIGHSTPYLYDAIATDPRYAHLDPAIHGLPEAQVLHRIFTECFDGARIVDSGCTVLVEDRSTNCGANAAETKRLLETRGIRPREIVVVQDPTMLRRTVASLEQVYADSAGPSPRFVSWPTFVPRVRMEEATVMFDDGMGVEVARLWSLPRFLGLVMGEIPRLRDDGEGYGPKGKGFIVHVAIPEEVEAAWRRLKEGMGEERWEKR
ncbi:YdcF family protein [Aspergillus clavatus NRRL 1]|uniref:DUF218 domain protein n=1 Tax=Aspergillus clavatus (strain ATCC 1007 / CBS 513.65 / DSM 816 / NCTC 3887 / NRRL 1 / QM 1276 / 107) TaxID=344612 RepID=A1CG63_ASPCL|nr:DUF218 domain protein [Aspergillus clavatus NRRL 1]EAW10943.1 DUF218 domain protein [Aspergillus clavatus NRRL 1]